jgi:hypothetical protein
MAGLDAGGRSVDAINWLFSHGYLVLCQPGKELGQEREAVVPGS